MPSTVVVALAGRAPLRSQAEEAVRLVGSLSGVAVRSRLIWDTGDLTTAPAPPWYWGGQRRRERRRACGSPRS